MPNFVNDNTAQGAVKSDLVTLPASAPVAKYIVATDWNEHRTALADVRTILRTQAITVKQYGAIGDGVADDRAAFIACLAGAAALGASTIMIPPGRYKLSKYVPLVGLRNLRIVGGAWATIVYASDDLTVVYDTVALNYAQARSAFLLSKCHGIVFEDLNFEGGDAPELTYQNLGAGVYATRTTGTRLNRCRVRGGAAIFVQDAAFNTGATAGNSIAISGSTVTLTNDGDVNYAFHQGMVDRLVTVAGATSPKNNGVFRVATVVSNTQLTFTNADGVTEAGGVWAVNDGDDDTILTECVTDCSRAVSYTGSGGTYDRCRFYRTNTPDVLGIPDAFSKTGTTVTLTDATGDFTSTAKGRWIKVAGTTGHDITAQITAVTVRTATAPATLTYENAAGSVSEVAAPGTARYWIVGGERCGKGNGAGAIAVTLGGIVTFTATTSVFKSTDVGKILRLTDSTSIGGVNNGAKVISRFISATQIEFVQTTALAEAYVGIFSIDSFDNAKGDATLGPAITARASTATAANSITHAGAAMVVNAYAGRILSASGGVQWLITSNTAQTFTLAGTGTPVAGNFDVAAGSTYGSTHFIYYFAGRSRCKVIGCEFYYGRTVGVKISGSSYPINGIEIAHNTFVECGMAWIAGADDAQEHSSMEFHSNRILSCGLGRMGWNLQWGAGVLGARGVLVHHNQFHADHDAVQSHVDGGALGGTYGFFAGRYVAGRSQPLDDVQFTHNTFTINATKCVPARVAIAGAHFERVGERAKWATAGTLTKVGNTMTLVDPSAFFTQEDVGASIAFYGAPNAGNNNTLALNTRVADFTVLSVTGVTTLTFDNVAGVGGGVAAGTYRVTPKTGAGARRGGVCKVTGNTFAGYGSTGIETANCVTPVLAENIFNGHGLCVIEIGSLSPRIYNNTELGTFASSTGARIQISSSTAWPIVHGNFFANGALSGGNLSIGSEGPAIRSDMGIGVDNSTPIDHPLLGVRGRCKATGGKAEIVFAYGSGHVDGDTIGINGVLYKYKAVGPGAGEFNSMASLIALVGSGFVAEDYGVGLTGVPTTGHIRMRLAALASLADHGFIDTINTLNPTALVVLRNDVAAGESIAYTRGEAIAAVQKRFVVWSPCVGRNPPMVQPDDAAAAGLMASSGWHPEKVTKNAGSCMPFTCVNATAGTEEFSWMIV